MFDIAWRLGDRALMRGKLRELERLSPQHYETGRARRIMSSVGQGPLVLLGWGLLLALAGVTTARAVVRLRGRSRLVAKAAGVAVLALVSLAGPARAEERAAGQLSDFKLDDADPEKSLPAHEEFRKNPVQYGYLVMDVADRAEEAVKAKDYPKAIKYYRTLVRMAPDRSIGFGKICEVYELAGDRPRALEACRQAIVTAGVRAEDYERFVRLTLAADTLDQTARTELGNVVAHLRKAPDGASAAADIECRVAVRLGDVAALQRCTAELARLVPDSDNNIGYEWALATLKRDSAAAERALARARQAGVNLAGLERMEQATRRAELTRSVGYGLAVVLVLAAGLLVWRRRELTGALARRAPPGSVV